MKSFLTVMLLIMNIVTYPQNSEKDISTSIDNVIVYIDGAQITRNKTIDLPKGPITLKFTGLSPYIDPKSINVKSEGNLTVLSVNHRQNFLTEKTKSAKSEELNKQKGELEIKIKQERAHLEILNDQLAFLKANSQIGGTNTGVNMVTLREAVTFYTEKVSAIKMKTIEVNSKIEELSEQLNKVLNQIEVLAAEKELPSGEILAELDVKAATKAKFEFSYLVKNAGWNPAYDIRVNDISQPVLLTYKANVHQNTGEEWKEIKLKLSSGNPKSSGTLPELKTYFLQYNTLPPSYEESVTEVMGYIRDAGSGEPLSGVSVVVKGTTIGTISDINGYYSINIPPSGGNLVYSFVGYTSQEQAATNHQINISLQKEQTRLQEVVVTGYGVENTRAIKRAKITGPEMAAQVQDVFALQSEVPLEIETTANQTSVEFEIETSYTVPSNGQNFTIDVFNFPVPADFQYYCIPKIDQQVYLNAMVTDWEKFNLLEGEASVFFENTFTRKTLIDIRSATDTLKISLGPDKTISVKRDLQRKFTTKQFLGNKKEETKSWMITLRNNKQQKVNITLYDQVPVSTMEEIEVSHSQLSGGKLDKESGKVTWELSLNPNEKREILLNYSVKYPKNKNLIVE